MKKLTAFLLSALILVTSVTAYPVFAEDNDYTYYLNFVQKLGIIDDITSPEKIITRGEFAEALCNIVFPGISSGKANEFAEGIFKEENYDTLLYPPKDVGPYDDVSIADTYYVPILKLKELLVMIGTGEREFSPDMQITYNQAATVIVKLLGYSVMVKDNNYITKAAALGVFDGLKYSPEKYITLNEVARILYNCFDIDMMTAELTNSSEATYVQNKGMTLYSEYMSVYKEKGQLEKNPFTSIYGDTDISEGEVVISNVKYKAEDYYEFYDYIGREVEIYYKNDEEDDSNTILWGYLTGKDEAITVKAEDVVSFENYVLKYSIGNRQLQKSVASHAVLIYNGIYKPSYTPEDFKFENGDVTIVKAKGSSSYNIIIVNNYKSMRVTACDASEKIIYAQQYDNNTTKKISLNDSAIESWRVQYFSADGGRAQFSDLSVGVIADIIENDGYIKIIISNDKILNMCINSIDIGDVIEYTYNDGEKIEMSEAYYRLMEAAGTAPAINKVYNAYLNSFGRIAYLESVNAPSEKGFVYITKVIKDEEQLAYGFLRYVNESGNVVTSEIKEKAKITMKDGTSFTIKDYDSISRLVDSSGSAYVGIAQIEKNEEGLITKINLPAEASKDRDNVFGVMVEEQTKMWCGVQNEKYFENIMLASDAIIFNVDDSKSAEKKYKILNTSQLTDAQSYTVSAYNFDSDSSVADCILVNGQSSPSVENAVMKMYIIDKVYSGYYDGETVNMAKAYEIAANAAVKETTLMCEAENDCLIAAETFFDTNAAVKLKKGDIIYAEFDDAYLSRAVLVYRIFTEEGENHLYATSGVYDPENGSAVNPYKLSNLGKLDMTNITSIRQSGIRFFGGSIYNLESDKYLTYTSQPISNGAKYDKRKSDSRYMTETVLLPQKYVEVEVDGDYIHVKDASAEDIISYQSAGNNCSELFISTNSSVVRQLVIINKI